MNEFITTTADPPLPVTLAGSRGAPPATPEPAKKGFSFGDVLDVINPLHHIPILGTLYRELTGDEIKPAARIAGGGLFGGLIGLVFSVFDGLVEGVTGKTVGENALGFFRPGGKKPVVRMEQLAAADVTRGVDRQTPVQRPTHVQLPAEALGAGLDPRLLPFTRPANAVAAALAPAAPGAADLPSLSPQAFETLMQSFDPKGVASLKVSKKERDEDDSASHRLSQPLYNGRQMPARPKGRLTNLSGAVDGSAYGQFLKMVDASRSRLQPGAGGHALPLPRR